VHQGGASRPRRDLSSVRHQRPAITDFAGDLRSREVPSLQPCPAQFGRAMPRYAENPSAIWPPPTAPAHTSDHGRSAGPGSLGVLTFSERLTLTGRPLAVETLAARYGVDVRA
jgi:hypothetical protein